MDKKIIKNLIQEAWNEGDSNPKDKFGDFLNRATNKISASLSEWLKEICTEHSPRKFVRADCSVCIWQLLERLDKG